MIYGKSRLLFIAEIKHTVELNTFCPEFGTVNIVFPAP